MKNTNQVKIHSAIRFKLFCQEKIQQSYKRLSTSIGAKIRLPEKIIISQIP